MAEVLPAAIIKEFEDGLRTVAYEEHAPAYGMNSCTFTATSLCNPQTKKPSIQRPVLGRDYRVRTLVEWVIFCCCYSNLCLLEFFKKNPWNCPAIHLKIGMCPKQVEMQV